MTVDRVIETMEATTALLSSDTAAVIVYQANEGTCFEVHVGTTDRESA